MATSVCLQRAGHAVGLRVAKVIAVVDPREVGPGEVDLLVTEDQLGPLDAQEVGVRDRSSAGHSDQEEEGDGGGNTRHHFNTT